MAAGSVFDTLSQSYSAKIVAAVAEVLRGNSTLSTFFGSSGIVIAPDPLIHADQTVPCLIVSPFTRVNQNRTGGELGKRLRVRIFILYQELRRSIAVTDKTVDSVLQLIEAALFNNYTLAVTAFGSVALVERINEFAALDFGAIGEGSNVKRLQAMEVEFWYRVEADTGEPA